MIVPLGSIVYDERNRLRGDASVFRGSFRGFKVAVKIVRKKVRVAEFGRQVENQLSRLSHPNVVKILHVEDYDDTRLYAMELCAGSLEDFGRMRYNGAMPSQIEALHQLTSGLLFIHSQGLLHHRIKPSNVLISTRLKERQPQLKWSDFGEPVDGATCWGAPELRQNKSNATVQFECRHSSFQCDTFVLGCVFFYLLERGVHPFGCSGADIAANITGANPVNFNQEHSVGALFSALIGSMIETVPVDRISLLEAMQVLIYMRHFEDRQGWSRLGWKDQKTIVKYLSKFQTGSRQKRNVRTVVHLAATNEETPELVHKLLENGGDPNALDQSATTPMHLVAQNRSQVAGGILQYLLIHGGNPNAATKWGQTPVHLVAQRCSLLNVDMLRMLLNAAGDPNAEDINGWCPLHVAASNQCSTSGSIVEELLRFGADINHKDRQGGTPAHCAARNASSVAPRVLLTLLVRGADTNLKDNFGMTARDYAASNPGAWASELCQMLSDNKKTHKFTSCAIS